MKKYDLIIFDCDGTLVDSEPITNGLIATMINEFGIEMSMPQSLEMFAGKSIMDITDYISQFVPDLNQSKFEREYRSRSLALFHENLKPIDGVFELLENLNIPYCIASNGPKMKMDVTLPVCGLDRYFGTHNTFSAYEVNAWKPAPELFIYAADKMNIPVNNALVIEDSWSGVMGAVNGGIDVWAFNPHFDNRLMLHGIPNFHHMQSIEQALKFHLN